MFLHYTISNTVSDPLFYMYFSAEAYEDWQEETKQACLHLHTNKDLSDGLDTSLEVIAEEQEVPACGPNKQGSNSGRVLYFTRTGHRCHAAEGHRSLDKVVKRTYKSSHHPSLIGKSPFTFILHL